MLTPPRRDMRSHWNPLHFAVTFGNWLCWCNEGYCTKCVFYTLRTKNALVCLFKWNQTRKYWYSKRCTMNPTGLADLLLKVIALKLQIHCNWLQFNHTRNTLTTVLFANSLETTAQRKKNKPVCLSFVFSQKAQAMFWLINKIWTQPQIIFMATGNFSTLKRRAVENETCHMVLYYSIIKAGFTILKSKYHQSD